jgi:hypothetical protein
VSSPTGARPADETLPAWVREVDFSLALHPHVLLTGNVRDQYPMPTVMGGATISNTYVAITGVLWNVCKDRGYGGMAVLDPVTSMLSVRTEEGNPRPEFLAPFVDRPFVVPDPAGTPRLDVGQLGNLLRSLTEHKGPPIALVLPYASRLFSAVGMPDPGLLELLGRVEALGHTATPTRPQPVPESPGETQAPTRAVITPFNTIFWLCERQEDLHPAFPLSSRSLRLIRVPSPTLEGRRVAARFAMEQARQPDITTAANALADVTHGMSVRDVFSCARVAINRGLPPDRYAEAARLMRVGVTDDPWAAEALREKLKTAEAYLNQRVLGQERAVAKTMDVLYRSAVGLNGAHLSSSPNRPRGVLFLSGPTGVGKTELAKGIASLVLGGDAEPLRFDMSEFRADEAHQRLIGAPPGYVGYDAGGELTNAVRSNPVCVLLFDEIEKAHPRIFDLFLQILEDGRLTDSRGATVHFTESFLIFTSNLGVAANQNRDAAEADGAGGATASAGRPTMRELVNSQMNPRQVEVILRQAYERFFNEDIGRPELRNRVGENYVALTYIDDETVGRIVDKGLRTIVGRVLGTLKADLIVSAEVRDQLIYFCRAKKDDGGRGINNVMEAALINPLSRHLFLHPVEPGGRVELVDLEQDDETGWVLGVK